MAVLPVSKVAPAGTRVLSTVRPAVPPVRSSMRAGSMPFSSMRYCSTLRVRWAAASGCSSAAWLADDDEPGGGLAVEGEGDVVKAALGFVVDADGTLAVTVEGDGAEAAGEGAGGTGGGGGAVIPTEVVAVACLPRSSTALQVTVTVPGAIAGGVERGGGAVAGDRCRRMPSRSR